MLAGDAGVRPSETMSSLNSDQIEQQQRGTTGHTRWVRISHWIVSVSFLTLAFTGIVILMAHPRLYWGEAGNNLTPALIELPISRNHRAWRLGKECSLLPGCGFSRQRESDLRNLQQERLGAESALSGGMVPRRARRSLSAGRDLHRALPASSRAPGRRTYSAPDQRRI